MSEEMNKSDFQLFKTIAQLKQNSLLKLMAKTLTKYYPNNIIITSDYILCKGSEEHPVMLVAHLDTVFKQPPERIYYDSKQRTMWSPQGLGADDRAGVFAIAKILQHGYRPYICLTRDEELGGLGAIELTEDFPECPFEDLKYIIELDRQGTNDCVFYNCSNEEFTNYIEQFGFITDWGTFSDISDICPMWEIAGVNLSIGYKNEHTQVETLNTDVLYSTIKKVEKMLDEAKSVKQFEYIDDFGSVYYLSSLAKYPGYWSSYKTSSQRKHQCAHCMKVFSEDDVFAVKSKKYKDVLNYYCIDCVADRVNWCSKCGEPFEMETPNDMLCPDCAGKNLPKNTEAKNGKKV